MFSETKSFFFKQTAIWLSTTDKTKQWTYSVVCRSGFGGFCLHEIIAWGNESSLWHLLSSGPYKFFFLCIIMFILKAPPTTALKCQCDKYISLKSCNNTSFFSHTIKLWFLLQIPFLNFPPTLIFLQCNLHEVILHIYQHEQMHFRQIFSEKEILFNNFCKSQACVVYYI